MVSNAPLSEQFRLAAKEWVAADAAANLLEECKTATLSQRMQALGEMPVSKAEMTIKASPEWKAYIEEMTSARRVANEKKLKLEWLRMRFTEWNSEEATKRAEMKL